MDFETYTASLSSDSPPEGLSPALKALWYAAKGNWDRAHRMAQDISTPDGSWVHAHLHREEGDDWNAGYWYRQAGQPHSQAPLEAEREEITRTLLESDSA